MKSKNRKAILTKERRACERRTFSFFFLFFLEAVKSQSYIVPAAVWACARFSRVCRRSAAYAQRRVSSLSRRVDFVQSNSE